jgi:uncharacterized protein
MEQDLSDREIIEILRQDKEFLRNDFGVINIGLFGSFAKGTQKIDSDIDLLVDFEEPRFEWIAGLQIYLETKFKKKIQLVRKRTNFNGRFIQRIGHEVIYA